MCEVANFAERTERPSFSKLVAVCVSKTNPQKKSNLFVGNKTTLADTCVSDRSGILSCAN